MTPDSEREIRERHARDVSGEGITYQYAWEYAHLDRAYLLAALDAQRAANEKLVAALYAAMSLIDGTEWWTPAHPALAKVRAALEACP